VCKWYVPPLLATFRTTNLMSLNGTPRICTLHGMRPTHAPLHVPVHNMPTAHPTRRYVCPPLDHTRTKCHICIWHREFIRYVRRHHHPSVSGRLQAISITHARASVHDGHGMSTSRAHSVAAVHKPLALTNTHRLVATNTMDPPISHTAPTPRAVPTQCGHMC
jgi:hypothetical protein